MLPETVLGLDEVVAREQVAVVLQREPVTAGLVEHAEPGAGGTVEVPERRLERLDEDAADVAPHPLVEDRRQERPELLWPHRPLGCTRPVHRIGPTALVQSLDDRDELHPVGPHLVAEEAVDLERVVAVQPVDGGQDVVLDAVLLEQSQAPHHVVERPLTALVHPVAVMQTARPVE